MQGEVMLLLLHEDSPLRARADLSPEQYRTANEAHMAGGVVAVQGILHRGRRVHRLSDVTSVRRVEGGSVLPVGCLSIMEQLEPGQSRKVLYVSRHERGSLDQCGGRDEKIHRRDCSSIPLVPSQQPGVGLGESVIGIVDVERSAQALNRSQLFVGSPGELNPDEELTDRMKADAKVFSFYRAKEESSRTNPSASPLAEEVHQDGRIQVDHSSTIRAGFLRRALIWASMASSVSSETRTFSRAARRSPPVFGGAKCSLMTCEKDWPGFLCRESAS